MKCKNRVALVTGAAGHGMGRSIALTLAREGAKMVINYRTSQEQAQTIVHHIQEQGGQAIAIQADIFEAQGCQALVAKTVQQFGQVDICVIGPGGGWHPEMPDQLNPVTALEDVQHELAPIYHLMPLVLPGMYEREWGRFIAIGLLPPYTSPAYAYNVGKAVRAQAILMARDAAWRPGVTLNVVSPGPVAGIASLDEAIEQCNHGPAWKQRTTASPQDIAEGVIFLCSEAGRFIAGCELPYLYIQE